MLFSVDETLLPRLVNLSTSFRGSPSLIKAHVFCFVCVHMEAYATCFPFQTMLQGFGSGGCIYQKRFVICVVRVRNSLCGVSSASFFCQREDHTPVLIKKNLSSGGFCRSREPKNENNSKLKYREIL